MEAFWFELVCGAAVLLIGMTIDAIRAVGARPIWEQGAGMAVTTDLRALELPFVGRDRRKGAASPAVARNPRDAKLPEQRRAA